MDNERRVILKADDYGGDRGVGAGIHALIKKGYISDVAVMDSFIGPGERDELLEAIDASPIKFQPGIGIILHVNLTAGKPLSRPDQVSSLVDKEGRFVRPQTLISAWSQRMKTLAPDHIKREIEAQINKYINLFGHLPHALDSHNIILAVPPVDEIAMKIAQDAKISLTYPKLYADNLDPAAPFSDILEPYLGLRKRYREKGILSADWCYSEYWNRFLTLDESVSRLVSVLSSLQFGVTELFFHPGHPDFISQSTDPRFERGRVRDFQILSHPKVREIIKTLTLTSYKELFQNFKTGNISID